MKKKKKEKKKNENDEEKEVSFYTLIKSTIKKF